jgi:hypothetical protein
LLRGDVVTVATNATAVVEALVEKAPALLDTLYSPDRCIAATRHGIEALAYFGIDAKPLKVMLVTGNEAWADWMNAGMPGGTMPEEAWSLGVDLDSVRPKGYAGHLVAWLPREQMLVDLSLGQFARPDRDMPLPKAAAFDVPEDFFTHGAAWSVTDDVSGKHVVLVYDPRTEKDWLHAPDWQRKPPLAGTLIRSIREVLE